MWLSVDLSFCPFVSLEICRSIYLSVYLSVFVVVLVVIVVYLSVLSIL